MWAKRSEMRKPSQLAMERTQIKHLLRDPLGEDYIFRPISHTILTSLAQVYQPKIAGGGGDRGRWKYIGRCAHAPCCSTVQKPSWLESTDTQCLHCQLERADGSSHEQVQNEHRSDSGYKKVGLITRCPGSSHSFTYNGVLLHLGSWLQQGGKCLLDSHTLCRKAFYISGIL